MLMLDEDRNDSRRLFNIAGPETEKVRWPNLVRVCGISSQYYWRKIKQPDLNFMNRISS
jgi:hypothetical protein